MAEAKVTRTGRLILELLICLLAFGLLAFWAGRKNLRMDAQLVFSIEMEPDAAVELEVDGQRIRSRVDLKNGFQNLLFKLPKKEIHKIRLYLGHSSGTLWFREVKIRTLLKSHAWEKDSLEKIFTFKNQIESDYVESGVFWVKIRGDSPFLGIAPVIPAIINRFSRQKWPFYSIFLILSILLFGFLHSFSFKSLRIAFPSKTRIPLVMIFLALVYFPLANSVLKLVKPLEITERRMPARIPEFRFDHLDDFLFDYGMYFNDHFVLRNHFIKVYNLILYRLFGISATSLVTVGKEGWLFLARETENLDETDYFRSVKPFNRPELEHWARILEQRRSWLLSRGIEYLFVVAPNKSTIYPEMMPDHIRRVRDISRLDQLLDYLGRHTGVKILDLRQPLLRAKSTYPVYFHTDSHWNDYGAYTAYREIMSCLADFYPEEKPMPLDFFVVVPLNRAGGDLSQALALEKRILRETNILMVPKTPLEARTVSRKNISQYVTQSISRCENGRLPLAMIVHDSFIHELRPFLAQHFSRMVFIWDWGLNLYPDIIKKENPWIVIEEMGERYLMDKILSNPEGVNDSFPRSTNHKSQIPRIK